MGSDCIRRFVAAAVIAAAVLSSGRLARADLLIDLRLSEPRSSSGKLIYLNPGDVGARLVIDVYAMVTGSNALPENFTSAEGAFITGQTGPGSLQGRIVPAGDPDHANRILPALRPFNAASSARGDSKDVPAPGSAQPDAVTDLGDVVRRGDDLGGLVVFRGSPLDSAAGTPIPDGLEFRIGRLELEIEHWIGFGQTMINWYFRQGPTGEPRAEAALFTEDGVNLNGRAPIRAGEPIIIHHIPEPAGLGIVCVALVLLVQMKWPLP